MNGQDQHGRAEARIDRRREEPTQASDGRWARSRATSGLASTRREGEKLLDEFFRKAGLDTRKLAALQKQYRAELQRVVDKQTADAIRRASRTKDTVHSSIKSQRDAFKLLAADKPFFPFPSVSLDKPFLIWATPHSNIISDSSIAPFDSWAKIRVESGQSSGF